MVLHAKNSVRKNLDDDVYASVDLSVRMPKYRFPDREQNPRHAYSVVHDELMLDGNSRQNLATFCQTWVEPEVHKLMDECLAKNMIDKDEYPQTAEIEARCVHMVADLWNTPEHANSRDLGSLLLADMRQAIDYCVKHPKQGALTAEEASGFRH